MVKTQVYWYPDKTSIQPPAIELRALDYTNSPRSTIWLEDGSYAREFAAKVASLTDADASAALDLYVSLASVARPDKWSDSAVFSELCEHFFPNWGYDVRLHMWISDPDDAQTLALDYRNPVKTIQVLSG